MVRRGDIIPDLRRGRIAKKTFDLPESLRRRLRIKAALENRSMNEIILTALRGSLEGFRLEPRMLERDPAPPRQGARSLAKEG